MISWKLWVPLVVAILFPLVLIVQMWMSGVPFSAVMVGLLGLWTVMTIYFIISLLRKRRRHLRGE